MHISGIIILNVDDVVRYSEGKKSLFRSEEDTEKWADDKK